MRSVLHALESELETDGAKQALPNENRSIAAASQTSLGHPLSNRLCAMTYLFGAACVCRGAGGRPVKKSALSACPNLRPKFRRDRTHKSNGSSDLRKVERPRVKALTDDEQSCVAAPPAQCCGEGAGCGYVKPA